MNARAAPVALLLGLSLVTNATLHATAARADGSAVKLPPVSGGHYDYPVSARRLAQQGRFLVELSISGEGRVTDVALLAADPKGVFDHSLVIDLAKLRFSVPRDWNSSGASTRRFKVNVLFLVRPCRETGPCVELAPLTSDPVITFTGQPIGT